MCSNIRMCMLLTTVLLGFTPNVKAQKDQTGDFAIYFLKNDTLRTYQVKQLPLESLVLADRPFIGMNDIAAYHWQQQEIVLTTAGLKKVKSYFSTATTKEPIPFVVVAGNQKVYLGNIFFVGTSYIVPDVPYLHSAFKEPLMIFKAPVAIPPDMRYDERVKIALEKKNKLKKAPANIQKPGQKKKLPAKKNIEESKTVK
jgi:hypothetical protein